MPVSYEFHQIPVADVIVGKNRQRKEFSKLKELKDSIARNGLLHPIILTRKNELVAGERRWRAFKELKMEMIPVHYLDELDEYEAKAIELEENIKRVDFTWKETCLAVEEYHRLRQAREERWTHDHTSEIIGLSPSYIGQLLQVARALQSGDKRVAAAENIRAAYNVIKRKHRRIVETEITQLDFDTKKDKKEKKEKKDEIIQDVSVEDFIEWAPHYEGRKFNFIHCDFPYGIGYDSTSYPGSSTWDKYDDSPEIYEALLRTLLENTGRLLYSSAHIMFWFSMHNYQRTLDLFDEYHIPVNPFPLLWHKDKGIIPDPKRGPRRQYETAFFASLGDRQVIKSPANIIYSPVKKRDHISTKPKPVLEHFFQMFVDDLTEILDPTCGGGSALAAAKVLGAKRVIGLDISEERADAAFSAVKGARKK